MLHTARIVCIAVAGNVSYRDDLDMVVRSALVALVLVVADEPADVEALLAPLARDPDVA